MTKIFKIVGFHRRFIFRKCLKQQIDLLRLASLFKPISVASKIDSTMPFYSEAIDRSSEASNLYKQLLDSCRQGGGLKGIQRHTEINKKFLVRERIRRIIDSGAEFFELSTTAGMGHLPYGDVPCGGTVTGVGKIQEVDVMIIANDATVKGGTSYPITVTKSLRAQEIAHKNRLPCLYIVDSGGAFLPLQSEIFPDAKHGGKSFANQALMSRDGIPQISLVVGLCTAGGAYTPTMSDQAVIVHKVGNIYLGGPPLVKAATGEIVSGEELGGAELHCSVSGVTDYFATTELESFKIVRDIFASINYPYVVKSDPNLDPPLYPAKDLKYFGGLHNLGRKEIYEILARILDGSRFSEFKTTFGSSLITGFARLSGHLVAVIANCSLSLEVSDAQKCSHFIQLCNTRLIPIIYLQNGPEFPSPHRAPEMLRELAKLAQCQSTTNLVPKITMNIGRACYEQNVVMCGPGFAPNFYFMWPLATLENNTSQWAAANLISDGIVEPEETRTVLGSCLDLTDKSTSRHLFPNFSAIFRM